MKHCMVVAMMIGLLASWSLAQEAAKPAPLGELNLKYKMVFTFTNLANEATVQKTTKLMKDAKKAGYNGIFISDTKIAKFGLQGKTYTDNLEKFRKACTDEGMQLMIGTCPMGYANDFLAADPNLAEGHPVRNAVFLVKEGKLVPVDDTIKLVNGSLEEWNGNTPVGWTVDQPDTMSFKDDQITSNGKPSLRQDHSAVGKNPARMWQKIKVQPWHYYHLTAMVKTENCTSKDFRLFALGGDAIGGLVLTWQPPDIKETMDWTRVDVTFNSLEYSEVSIYAGSYSPKAGKIWWGDVKIEPAGFVNIIRRDDLPLTITSEDGKTTYNEGKDFSAVKDPKLGNDPNPGYFTDWHDVPAVTIPAGSQIKDGQRVLASYHHSLAVGKRAQMNCCFSEPKVYDLIEKQIAWVKQYGKPDIYMMSHDEIRDGGWDDSCSRRKLTTGQILADNVAKCSAIIQKADPGKPIMTWNDMFDPFHNAKKEGRMYLAKGEGPWYGSWEGLPASVIVLNWHNNKEDSLKFFSDRGNPQVLAGYYDQDPKRIVAWLEMASKVKGVQGVMYTTWKNDYSKIDQFMTHVKEFEASQGKKGN